MVTKRTSPPTSRGVGTLQESRREILRGRQESYFCTKIWHGFGAWGRKWAHKAMGVVSESGGESRQQRNAFEMIGSTWHKTVLCVAPGWKI